MTYECYKCQSEINELETIEYMWHAGLLEDTGKDSPEEFDPYDPLEKDLIDLKICINCFEQESD